MYGGVSLAIYMYGVTEELWRLVRATAPDRPDHGQHPASGFAYPEEESTEAVYRQLARMLPWNGPTDTNAPVRTRFVIDLISGTSAGGINGICLAKALSNETSLTPLKDVWVKEGDIAVLLDDDESTHIVEDDGTRTLLKELGREGPPRSLLNSRRMLRNLIEALAKMNGPDDAPFSTRLVEELDLWVTATDLVGLETTQQLDHGAVVEKRHGHRSHFRYAPNEERNDFSAGDSAFLAYAARCTSAFPFAFDPMTLDALASFSSVNEAWEKRFYSLYRDARPSFATRAFSDGGILDNKPFTSVVEALGRRRASLPVERKLIFIEPDPAVPGGDSNDTIWNAISTAQAATLGIPRVETIREDLRDVTHRNRTIQQVRGLSSLVHRDAAAHGKLVALTREQPNEAWAAQTLAETAAGPATEDGPVSWGPTYGTYHRMKVGDLVGHLATIISRAAGFDAGSDEAVAVAYLVQAWKTARYEESGLNGRLTDNAFLIDFDVPYRARRVGFVIQKLRELTSSDDELVARALEPLDLPLISLPPDGQSTSVIRRFREGLHWVRWRIQSHERKLSSAQGPLAAARSELILTREVLRRILNARTEERMLRVAREILAARGDAPFDTLVAIARRESLNTADAARTEVNALLGEHSSLREAPNPRDLDATLQHVLRFYYDAFEAYDLVLYPLQFETPIGEGHLVGVARISPGDASLPVVPTAARELKGISLHHFAAFLDEGWRRHDIAWGRLNAAECLIKTLLPDSPDDAEALIKQAHRTIVREYEQELEQVERREPHWKWYDNKETPDEAHMRRALTRAAGVVGPLVQGILDEASSAQAPLLQRAAEKQGGLIGRALKGSQAKIGWALVARALNPNQSTLSATGRVLLALLLTPVAEFLVVAAIIGGFLLWGGTGWFYTVGSFLLVGVGLALAALVLGTTFLVWKLRKMVFAAVNNAVLGMK